MIDFDQALLDAEARALSAGGGFPAGSPRIKADALSRAIGAGAPKVTIPPPAPTWKDVRRMCDHAAAKAGEWGGAPIPMDHVRLVMEPRYPFKGLHGMKLRDKPAETPDDFTLVNTWSTPRGVRVYVFREADGRTTHAFDSDGPGARLEYWMNTLGVAAGHAWDADVEARALVKLKSLVTPHAFHCYTLAGGFLETSPRSKVTYIFRKLRPTIALRPNKDGKMKCIAVLCLHPLGYYADTWAGVMTPTDDVVAHLLLMRGDEHRFWKKSNQHELSAAAAGI